MDFRVPMTTNITSLQDVKEKQKFELIASDLETVLYLLRLIKSGLQDYSMYIPVKDVVINIIQNEKILVGHQEKIAEKLEKIYGKT